MSDGTVETTEFPEGNLFLTLTERRFHVNKDFLIDKSGFFKDLFDTAKQEEEDSAEPSIPVQDDAEHFTVFIHALHGNSSSQFLDDFFPKHRRSTVNIISHALDLCDKYIADQEDVKEKLSPYIVRDWPESLSDWDANEEEIQKMQVEMEEKFRRENSYLTDELDELLPEPATVIRFAYIYAPTEKPIQPVPKYLPAAFYHLSRIPPYADPDDSTFSAAEYYDDPALRTAKKSLLRPQDFVNLLQGLYEIRSTISQLAFKTFPAEVEGGNQPESETKIMLEWWRKFGLLKLLGPDERPDPLQRLKEIMDSLEENTSDDPDFIALYQQTSVAFRRRMRAFLASEREAFWGSLTEKFSLYSFFY